MNETNKDRILCLQRIYWRLETISTLLWHSRDTLSEDTFLELSKEVSNISEKVCKELGWKRG